MYFDQVEDKASDSAALGDPATFGQRASASFQSAYQLDNVMSGPWRTEEAYDRRNKAIKDALGDDMPNPMRGELFGPDGKIGRASIFGQNTQQEQQEELHSAYQRKLDELALKRPDLAHIIRADKPIRAEVAENARKAEEEAQNAQRNYGGPWGTGLVADFAGGMAASAYDPVNLATLFVGPTSHVGLGMRQIFMMAGKQALANAGVTAAMQPTIQDWRRTVGVESGFGQGVENTLTAGAFGFGVDLVGRGVYRGIQRGMGRVPILDNGGKVTGYESQEAGAFRQVQAKRAAEIKSNLDALAPDVKTAAEDALTKTREDLWTPQQTDAVISYLEATKATDDPSVKGAIEAYRRNKENPFKDVVDDGRGLRDLARAIEDGDSPAPAPREPINRANDVVTDRGDLPPGREGTNQHTKFLDVDGKPVEFRTNIKAGDIGTDAGTFQFKGGTDANGVNGTLVHQTAYDPAIAGRVVVYERADGTLVIADGHQRLDLARRLGEDPEMSAFIFKEKDGWTPGEVRDWAAKKNIEEGTGGLIDTARALRDNPAILNDRMPVETKFMGDARALSRLSDDAFGRVAAGTSDIAHGVMVGDLVRDATRHSEVLDKLGELNPQSEDAARSAIAELTKPVKSADDIAREMGSGPVPEALVPERNAVLSDAIQMLGRGSGDPQTAVIADVLYRLSQKSGIVNDWLNDAARAVADGQPRERTTAAFLRRIQEQVDKGGVKSLDGNGPLILASMASNLDMSPEARKERAEAMGFDTSKVWYRGRAGESKLESFDTSRQGYRFGDKHGGIFLSSSERVAGAYADHHALSIVLEKVRSERERPAKGLERILGKKQFDMPVPSGQQILGLYVRPGKQAVIDLSGKELVGINIRSELQRLKDQGYDTVLVRETPDALVADENGKLADELVVFDPSNIRSVNATFDPSQSSSALLLASLQGSDPSIGKSMRADLDALGYYSKALEAAKGLKQEKGTPEQMLAMLKAAGVKDAEVQATGLAGAFTGKSVTKADIIKHLEQNRVPVREATYGGMPGMPSMHPVPEGAAGGAKWKSYSLDPMNKTYRETVLHLPSNNGDVNGLVKSGAINADNYEAAYARRSQAPDFESGHWNEPNVIAHMRTSMQRDAQGRPVFHIDELQSDWGQKLRDGGVRDEAKIAELRQKIESLAPERDDLLKRIHDDTSMYRGWGDSETGMAQWARARGTVNDEALMQNIARLRAELRTAEAATPGHPLVNTTDQWVNTAMRRAIRQAVEADADFIAIPSGETVHSYGMGAPLEGLKYAYNEMYPKNLRNILQKMDKSVQAQRVEHLYSPVDGKAPERSHGHTLFPLTDEIKRKVMEEGQPLFGKPGAKQTKEALDEFSRHLSSVLDEQRAQSIPRMDDVRKEGPAQIAELREKMADELAQQNDLASILRKLPTPIDLQKQSGDARSWITLSKAEMQQWFERSRQMRDQAIAEYRSRQSPTLDMAPEARKARAEAQGFDTSTVYYHGTNAAPFSAFKRDLSGKNEVAGIHLALNKDTADQYGGRVMEVYVRRGKGLEVTPTGEPRNAADAELLKSHGVEMLDDPMKTAAQLEELGFTHVVQYGFEKKPEWIVVFDPKNIRDVKAAFDPNEASSPRLLASTATQSIPSLTDIYSRFVEQGKAAADAIMPGMGDRIEQFATANADVAARIAEALKVPERLAEAQKMLEQSVPMPESAPAQINPRVIDLSKPVLLSPEYSLARAEIMREIDRTIAMLPPDWRIQIEDRLVYKFDDGDGRLLGLMDGYDRIVHVAMEMNDPVRAARHEVVHVLRQTGLMSDAEFSTLYKMAEKLKLRDAYAIDAQYLTPYTKQYGNRGRDFVEQLLREETIAHMFSDYSTNGRRFGDIDGGFVDRIIDKIVSFMKTIRDIVSGHGFKDAVDIFQSIESGDMARRAMDQVTASVADVAKPKDIALPGGGVVRGVNATELSQKLNELLAAITAYHGSPYDFDKFDLSRIGTGEGAQAYGHGIYLAENEGVAKSYTGAGEAGALQREAINQKLRTIAREMDRDPIGVRNPDLRAKYASALAEREKLGRMYEVRINADPEHFLDWDKPLSQQSEKVQQAARKYMNLADGSRMAEVGWKNIADRPIDQAIGGVLRADTSGLREAGIPGIKYLDQGSRGKGEGSYNYVVFDDKLIQIVKKDGKPVDLASLASERPRDDGPSLQENLFDAERTKHTSEVLDACRA